MPSNTKSVPTFLWFQIQNRFDTTSIYEIRTRKPVKVSTAQPTFCGVGQIMELKFSLRGFWFCSVTTTVAPLFSCKDKFVALYSQNRLPMRFVFVIDFLFYCSCVSIVWLSISNRGFFYFIGTCLRVVRPFSLPSSSVW